MKDKTKNIITTFAENYTLTDGENKGRQGLKNIGTKNGYYITNGQAIKITCTKNDRKYKISWNFGYTKAKWGIYLW